MLTIALDQTAEGKWYTSTLQLQLVSFEACVSCRGVRTLRVTVDKRMPLSLWGDDDSMDDEIKTHNERRLPALRAAGVSWTLPASMFAPVLLQAALLRDVEWMQRTGVGYIGFGSNGAALPGPDSSIPSGARFVRSPRIFFETMLTLIPKENDTCVAMQSAPNTSWPSALRQLSIGCTTAERIIWVTLPDSLDRLVLGGRFDQPIQSVAWPASLKQLTLGECFDQPIADVGWPTSLMQLTFGFSFNQPIAYVNWPASLLQLQFEGTFDQPIAEVLWPLSLERLSFGDDFNQPIADVVWPSTLRKLAFGESFEHSIAEVVWPVSLTHLVCGDDFNHAIEMITWPSALQYLAFGTGFVQPIERAVWPASLRFLAFGDEVVPTTTALVLPPFLAPVMYTSCDAFSERVKPFDWPAGIYLFDQPHIEWV